MEYPMKLGFIALSGIRAENPALTELGLTMPGLVERNKIVAALPSLGLLTLAGMTPDNIEAAYVEVPDVQAHSSLPVEADVVAISSFSARIKDAYALADRYRSSGATVLMGGLHVSAMPLEALEHADSVVIGEGEPKWPQIVTDLQRGQLQRVYDAGQGCHA